MEQYECNECTFSKWDKEKQDYNCKYSNYVNTKERRETFESISNNVIAESEKKNEKG